MKKLFTIAALFIFMILLTSYTPNEVGGGGRNANSGNVELLSENSVGGGGRNANSGNIDLVNNNNVGGGGRNANSGL